MGDTASDLVQQVVLHWRVRCALRRVPVEAASGPDALALVTALAATVERGYPPPGLDRAARAWAANLADPAHARGALRCLAEIAVQLVADAPEQFSPAGLDPVFDQLIAEAAVTAQADARAVAAAPDRRLLERRLERAVADALRTGGDIAVGVVELERPRRSAPHLPGRAPIPVPQEAMEDLASALQRMVGAGGVHRLGTRRLAVLVPGADTAGLGDLFLQATARAPSFTWGTASLGAVGSRAVASPDALVVLAEADLHLRRRDLVRARGQITRRHHRSALAATGSALVLVLGILVGLNAAGGNLGSSPQAALGSSGPALPLRGGPGQPARAPSIPGGSSSAPPPPAPAPTPARDVGALLPATGTPDHGANPPPPAGPRSTAPPPGGSTSPLSPVTAALDQVLATAVGVVGSLTGVQLDSAGGRQPAAGPGTALAGG